MKRLSSSTLKDDVFHICLGFLVVLLLFISVPVYAFSSLNSISSCVKSPACARSIGVHTAVKSAPTAANNIVPFTISGGASAGASSVSIGAQGTNSILVPLVVANTGINIYGITQNIIARARGDAEQNIPPQFEGGQQAAAYRVTYTAKGTKFNTGPITVENVMGPIIAIYPGGTGSSKAFYRQVAGGPLISLAGGTSSSLNPTVDVIDINIVRMDGEPDTGGNPPPNRSFDDLSDSEKDDLIDEILPNLTINPGDIAESLIPVPDGSTSMTFEPDSIIDSSGNVVPADGPVVIPTAPDTDGDGIPDSEDSDIDGDGIENDQDSDSDGDGVEDVTQNQNEIDTPIITAIEPQTFTAPGFFEHGIAVFSNKFPFDIGGEFTATGVNECPTYSFFGDDYELCPIRDAVSILRYPVIISVLIWCIIAL